MLITRLPFTASILATPIALTACGGSSSSSNAQEGLSNDNIGTAVMSVKGGDALYEAGDGGNIEITKAYSNAPLNISLKGSPATDYDFPEVTIDLGTNPAEITTDITIFSPSTATEVGDLYITSNRMYRYDGAVDETEEPIFGTMETLITGLKITATGILKFDTGSTSTYIYLSNDIQNDGEITVPETAESYANNLEISAFNYVGSGNIDVSGQVTGQDAGGLSLSGNIILNSGTINASGAEGDDLTPGGNAGDVDIYSQILTGNSGSIIANSGSSTGQGSGTTAYIDLYGTRDVVNIGSISASAGSGVNENSSYNGGDIEISASNVLLNTGSITANGSDSILNTAGDAGGEGGDGGQISLYLGEGGEEGYGSASDAPHLINTGTLQADGGDSAYDSNVAGDGGDIDINSYESYGDSTYMNPSLIAISGNLLAEGGDATGTSDSSGEGGEGGYIEILHYSQIGSELPTQIDGYESLNASGGDALRSGDAGNINIEALSSEQSYYGLTMVSSSSSLSYGSASSTYAPAPPIDIETDLLINGGESIASGTLTQDAGHAGYLSIGNYSSSNNSEEDLTISFVGDISANASNVNNGDEADGGYISVFSPQDIVIHGDINLNASSDTAIPADGESDGYNEGGEGGSLFAVSTFAEIDFDSQFTANGGAGQLGGGDGGFLFLTSTESSTVDGSISVTGGNASTTEVNGEETKGGDGGLFYIISNDLDTNLQASYVFTPGTGTTTGTNGGVYVDGNCLDGICINADLEID
jgi:hypothetical protein